MSSFRPGYGSGARLEPALLFRLSLRHRGTEMSVELRQDCEYALLTPTSMGLRLTPAAGQPVHSSDTFVMHATSAESNVLSVGS